MLQHPITNIDTTEISPDLTYNDNLIYHYLGGVALAALKKWKEAEEYFEICVTSPGSVAAALQMEALKKLRLVQLVSMGKVGPPYCALCFCSSYEVAKDIEPSKVYTPTARPVVQIHAILDVYQCLSPQHTAADRRLREREEHVCSGTLDSFPSGDFIHPFE